MSRFPDPNRPHPAFRTVPLKSDTQIPEIDRLRDRLEPTRGKRPSRAGAIMEAVRHYHRYLDMGNK